MNREKKSKCLSCRAQSEEGSIATAQRLDAALCGGIETSARKILKNKSMKKIKIHLILSLTIILAALAVPVTQTGCSSVERTTYQAVGVTQVSVDTAMAVWNSHVAAGKASTTQEMQVKKAYEQYQLAAFIVIDTAKSASAKTNSPALNQVLASASTSLANLINLIRSFGAKI